MWLKDPKTGEQSVTLTFFALGFVAALLKLLASGMVIATVTLQPFTGGEFAAVIASLGGVYALRRANSDKPEDLGK